jgi:hypothetical protein
MKARIGHEKKGLESCEDYEFLCHQRCREWRHEGAVGGGIFDV